MENSEAKISGVAPVKRVGILMIYKRLDIKNGGKRYVIYKVKKEGDVSYVNEFTNLRKAEKYAEILVDGHPLVYGDDDAIHAAGYCQS